MSLKLFEQRRPAYEAKTGVIKRPIVPFKKVRFVVDDDTTRPATTRASGAKPRVPLGVEAMRKIDEQTYGAKVQLSEKTLDKLFNVRVDDPTDVSYLAKKAQLEAEGKSPEEIRALLGRQRQITKRVNLADASLAVEDKLELLERAVQTGFDNTSEGLSAIIGQTSLLVGDGTFLDKMTPEDLTRLRDLLRDIDMPKDYRRAGFQHRIYNLPQYRDESGLINIYLMSHLEGDRTLDTPLLGVETSRGRQNPKLTGYVQYMTRDPGSGKNERYIDLQERKFLTREEAMDLANEGVDGGVLGGEMMPEDGWSPKVVPDWALTKNEYRRRYDEEKGESKSDGRAGAVGAVGAVGGLPPSSFSGRPRTGRAGRRRGRKMKGTGAGASSRMTMGTDDEGKGEDVAIDESGREYTVPNEQLPVGQVVLDDIESFDDVPYAESIGETRDLLSPPMIIPPKGQPPGARHAYTPDVRFSLMTRIQELRRSIQEMEQLLARVNRALEVNDDRREAGLISDTQYRMNKTRYERRQRMLENGIQDATGRIMSLELDPSV